MGKLYILLETYGLSHQNKVNKLIHWICVPLIMFSLIGLILHIPFVFIKTWYFNWASLVLLAILIYYFRLSKPIFLGFIIIGFLLLKMNWYLIEYCSLNNCNSVITLVIIFTIAWIGQFIGHKIEGKKPSFLEDIQYLLIGPAWLLHFIYKKLGISY
ncbi:MAG: DUF962 domain-containing protein [Saprospiraceae bacterium]|nr:DUF962 domain-containing protein [Saprospiraceae bacterium]